MAIFRRQNDNIARHSTPPSTGAAVGSPGSAHQADSRTAQLPWSDINAIRAEWPEAQLNPVADMESWRQGMQLYEADGYPSMMRAAPLLSAALAHNLYGEGVLMGSDLPETVNNVLYASVEAPPDGKSFAESARRCARLALTIVREYGWQPTSMGGSGQFDRLIDGSYFLFATAIAGAGQSAGDLNGFFAVAPQPVIEHIRDSQAGTATVEALFESESMRRQAEAGDTDAMTNLASGLLASSRDGEAEHWYRKAAQAGNAEAMTGLGWLLEHTDRAADAEQWYREAADEGHLLAMTRLAGLLSRTGRLGGAEQWWRQAASLGDIGAMVDLGAFLANNGGDMTQAEQWFRKAAEAGHDGAMNNLGLIRLSAGKTDQAEQWFRKAAEAGHIGAMNNLGRLTNDGGVVSLGPGTTMSRDRPGEEAESWWRKAAEAGHVGAMHSLGGLLYRRGRKPEAEHWYHKASLAGNAEAMESLAALLYGAGQKAEAAQWFARADEAKRAAR